MLSMKQTSIKQNKPCKLIKNTYYTDTSYLLVFDDLLIAFQRLYFKSNICSGFVKAFLSHVLVSFSCMYSFDQQASPVTVF